MDIKDFDTNKIKVAIFDFDDTLAIHTGEDFAARRRESEDKRLEYYLKAYKNPDTFYDTIEPCTRSETMYKFICRLRENNITVYCMSGMKYSFHLKAKQAFIDKHYGQDIEVVSTANQELKIDGVKILQKCYDCKLDEILFVDDKESVIELMNSNGIKGMLVTDFIDNEKDGEKDSDRDL